MERVSGEFRERTLKVLRYAFLSGLVLEFMTAAAIALVAVVLGVRLINGAISFQEAFLVLLLTPEFYRPLRELGAHRHAGMEGKAAAERIFEILDTPVLHGWKFARESLRRAEVSILRRPVSPIRGGTYPALDGATLTLPAGSRHGRGRAQRLGEEHAGRFAPAVPGPGRRGHLGERGSR